MIVSLSNFHWIVNSTKPWTMSDFTHFVSLASNSGAGTSWKLNVECMTKMNKQASQQVKTKERAPQHRANYPPLSR